MLPHSLVLVPVCSRVKSSAQSRRYSRPAINMYIVYDIYMQYIAYTI